MSPEQDNTPVHSQGYGPAEHADDTRQAQQTVSNDAPTDVNFNSIVARSQSLTVNALGKGFVANQERRQIIADKRLLVDTE